MLTARQIMTPEVVTVKKTASIEELVELFVKHKVNGIPVVDDQGKVVGIVTEGDLIERNKNLHIPTVISLFDAVIVLESAKKFEAELKKLTAKRVEDIYNPKPITVKPDQTVGEIAALMANNDIHTLPVLDNGKLVGIIGKLDIIKAMAQD